MIANHPQFIEALAEQKMVRVEYYSKLDQGVVDRECAPLDYGPDPADQDALNRYWIWDYAVARELNPLGLLAEQMVKLNVLGSVFDLAAIDIANRTWLIPRTWGTMPAPAPAAAVNVPPPGSPPA